LSGLTSVLVYGKLRDELYDRKVQEPMTAKTAPKTPKPEPEAPTNAVVIVKIVNDAGDIGTDVQPIGDVLVTEVQTLIDLARASWRAKIGLDA
jgi:hypothetical protein